MKQGHQFFISGPANAFKLNQPHLKFQEIDSQTKLPEVPKSIVAFRINCVLLAKNIPNTYKMLNNSANLFNIYLRYSKRCLPVEMWVPYFQDINALQLNNRRRSQSLTG